MSSLRVRSLAIGLLLALSTARSVAAPCPGDLDGDERVSIDELVTSVNSALKGCPPADPQYVDNGDGTVTDTEAGLVWEKKTSDGSIHDRDNTYSLSTGEPWQEDGTAYTVFLAALNEERFAGHDDWRLPTLQELIGLVDYARFLPAIDPAFDRDCGAGCDGLQCSCTLAGVYWSASTTANDPSDAWAVSFLLGSLNDEGRNRLRPVRAVRSAP